MARRARSRPGAPTITSGAHASSTRCLAYSWMALQTVSGCGSWRWPPPTPRGTMLVVSESAADEAARLSAQATLIEPALLSPELLRQATGIQRRSEDERRRR